MPAVLRMEGSPVDSNLRAGLFINKSRPCPLAAEY